MESVVRMILLMWMLVTVVAAGPTEAPSGTVIPFPNDYSSPVPTQPIANAKTQGRRPIQSTTPGLVPVATTKTINTKVAKKTVPAAAGASAIGSVSTTVKTASGKVLSPVKSVNGHPASHGKEKLPTVENAKKHILETKESSDKIGANFRQTDSNRRSPAQKIENGRVSIDEAKTDSVASQSMARASNVIAPPSLVQLPPDMTTVQNVEKTLSGVLERKHKNISNAEKAWADFRIHLKSNTNVINKQNKNGSETITPTDTFNPIRLVGKKVIPKHFDSFFTFQSRIDHDIPPFPVVFPSFTKAIETAFQPSRQFDQRFPDQNSYVPSRPPALAAPFIQIQREDIHKTMTSKSPEAKEVLPKHNRTLGNEKAPATNSKASTNQTETDIKSRKEMSELSETTVTPLSRKIVESSSKLSSNTKNSRNPPRIQQSPTQATYSSRIKTSEGNKELRKIEPSRNQTRVEKNSDEPGSGKATKAENPALSYNASQSTNTTSRLASTIHPSQPKLPSRTNEISWSNIMSQQLAHSKDKISIVKEIVAQERNEEKIIRVSTKNNPTKAIIVKKYAPSITSKNNVTNRELKPVESQLKSVPIRPTVGSDKINNTIEIDRLNFKLPTEIRDHRNETPDGDSMVAASQVSLTELSLEMARPFRTHRILGGSPRVQQVLNDLDDNAHQFITVTNQELDELLRSAPPSVKIRSFDTLGSAEKKLVMQNLQEVENNNFREVPRQPELYEDDVPSSLIRQLTPQRRPSVNSQASRKSRPTKHSDHFQDSGVFDVKTPDYIKISGEEEFLKFAESDNFFGNLKDHPKKPVRHLHLQADQMFSKPDMRVTKLSPVQVMRNVGNDNNFDGLGVMLDKEQNSREDNVFYEELASVRENSGQDIKWKEVRHHDRHPAFLTTPNPQSQEQRHPLAKPHLLRSIQPQDQRHPVPTTQVLRDTQPQEQRHTVPKSQQSQNTQPQEQRHTVPKSQQSQNTQPQEQRHPVPKSQQSQNTQPQEQRHKVPTSQLVQNSQPQDQGLTVPTSQLVRNNQSGPLHHSVSGSQLLVQQQQLQELQKLQLEKQEKQLRTQLQQELREQGKLLQKIEIQEENQRRANQLQQQLDKQKEEQLQKQRQQHLQLQFHQQEQQRLKRQHERQKEEQLKLERQKEEQLKLERQKEEQLQKQGQKQVQLQPQEKQMLPQQIEKQKEERLQKPTQQPIQIQQKEQRKQQEQLEKEKEEQHQKLFLIQQQEQQELLQQQQQAQEAIERQRRDEIEKQKQIQQRVHLQPKEHGKKQLAVEGKQATAVNWLQFERQPNLPVTNLDGQRPSTLEQLPLFVKGETSSIQLTQFPRSLPLPEPVLLEFLDQIPDNIDELQAIDGNRVELQMSASIPGLAEVQLRNNREAVYPEFDPRFFPESGYNIMPYFLGFPSFGYFDMDVNPHKE